MNDSVHNSGDLVSGQMPFNPRRTAVKISLGYAAAGWLWVLSSDHLIPYMTSNLETMVILNSIKGSLFILVTAFILFGLVYSQLRAVARAQSLYFQSVQSLKDAHESLIASEEVLRRQFDELLVQTKLNEDKDKEMWSLFENMNDALAVYEIMPRENEGPVDLKFLLANNALQKLTGFSAEELIDHGILEIFPEMERDFIEVFEEVTSTGTTRKLSFYSQRWKKHLSVSIYCPRRGRLAFLAADVTDERIHERTVERLAYYDSLTGLPNRLKLHSVLNVLMKDGPEATTGGALLYIDMDDLKLVNDAYGHSYGDGMIITAAMYLVSVVDSGSLVARVGGDEFVVLVPGAIDSGKVEILALKIIETLSREYEVRESRFHGSVSVGIALFPQDGKTVEEILMNADTALYEAKRRGKRCCRFFRQSMKEIAYENMQLINGLRNALANHELEVYYQPQISICNRRVIAFEALLRWRSDKFGNVPPSRFIPLAEKSILIESIGTWVLQQACSFLNKLAEMGYPDIRVAVNISPRQLVASDFIKIIRESFAESALMAARLEIEITENILIESMEEGVRTLDELNGLGVHLSLDDFGTGYSSLTYLRRLPVKTVKIDKSFIDLVSADLEGSALIASIIDMAHALGLSVVAEGVETKDQLDKLIKCRCDTIQGYLVSKAVPEEAAIKFLKDDIWDSEI